MTATATATGPAPTCTPAIEPGMLLPCPQCGEAQATITLCLSTMVDLHCQDCDADFTRADVETFIARWGQVLRWLDAAPSNG